MHLLISCVAAMIAGVMISFYSELSSFYRVYLAQQFEFLRPQLDERIPVNKKAFLQQFYSQVRLVLIMALIFYSARMESIRKMIRRFVQTVSQYLMLKIKKTNVNIMLVVLYGS